MEPSIIIIYFLTIGLCLGLLALPLSTVDKYQKHCWRVVRRLLFVSVNVWRSCVMCQIIGDKRHLFSERAVMSYFFSKKQFFVETDQLGFFWFSCAT
jgi:hypothetical protein